MPLWVLINALTIGTKSVMFNVLTQDLKASIAKEFHVNPKELSQMNHVATRFRNTCAHGDRLYNKRVNESIPDLPIHQGEIRFIFCSHFIKISFIKRRF